MRHFVKTPFEHARGLGTQAIAIATYGMTSSPYGVVQPALTYTIVLLIVQQE